MGILDDAIKEHLELKRQHGADEPELKQLEDEAFGAAERPGSEAAASDPLAEAPTEFMAQPDAEQQSADSEAAPAPAEEAPSRPAPRAEIADLQEAPPSPSDEEAEPEAPVSSGPTTEEREAIAEQPTEMFDVEDELASQVSDSDGEIEVEAAEAEAEDEYDEDDDFWDEKRLSDELDQALEAPSEIEDEEAAAVEPQPVSDAEDEPSGGEDEDVLEETPDFLEETPEDDQLWFEQKPPKDFDFDD